MKNSRPITACLPWLLALPAAVFAQQMPDTARALKTLMEGSYGTGNGSNQAASMQPMASAQGGPLAGGMVHTVRPGETLARVVQQVYGSHPYKDAPVFRLIVQRNPDAFIGGNHNRLKAGAQLVLPALSELHAALTGQHPSMQGRMTGGEAMSARSGASISPASGKTNYPGPSASAGQSTSSSDPRRGWVRFP